MHYCRYPKSIQIEITSNCNAACLYCQRQKVGLPPKNVMLDIKVFQNVLDSEAGQKLEVVEFNGTIDDPLMRPDLFKFLDLAYYKGIKKLSIHTNASLRSPDYWKRLARRFSKNRKGQVKFNIDGLADTNHIYRVNTNFDKIMENANAFIAAGGRAVWQFIEFDWNSHQIETARDIAMSMGFEEFRVRRKKPSADTLLIEDKPQIQCFYGQQEMYLIRYDGAVIPCCFYSPRHTELPFFEGAWNNLYNHTFDEIINHKFYAEELTQLHPTLEKCIMHCGKHGTINGRLNQNEKIYD